MCVGNGDENIISCWGGVGGGTGEIPLRYTGRESRETRRDREGEDPKVIRLKPRRCFGRNATEGCGQCW